MVEISLFYVPLLLLLFLSAQSMRGRCCQSLHTHLFRDTVCHITEAYLALATV